MTDSQEIHNTKRWSAQRKLAVVMRLIRGEPIDEVSREIAIPISTLEEWRDRGVQFMTDGLKARVNDPLEAELNRAKKQIGELTMHIELLQKRCKRATPLVLGRYKK